MKDLGSQKKKFFKSKKPSTSSTLMEEDLSIPSVHLEIFRTQSSDDFTWF
jgi:hypothetical protein